MDGKSNLRSNYHQGQTVNRQFNGRKFSTPQRISLSSTRTNSLSSQRSKSKSKSTQKQQNQSKSPINGKQKRKWSPHPIKMKKQSRSKSNKRQASWRKPSTQHSSLQIQMKPKNRNDKNLCQFWNQGKCMKEENCNKQHFKTTQIAFFQKNTNNNNESNKLMNEGKTAITIHKTVWINNNQLAQTILAHKDDLKTSISINYKNSKSIKSIKNAIRKVNRNKYLNLVQKQAEIAKIINENILNTQQDNKQKNAQLIKNKKEKIKKLKKERAEEKQKQINLIEFEENNTQTQLGFNQQQIVTKLQQLKNRVNKTKNDELNLNQEEQQQYVKILVDEFNQTQHTNNNQPNDDVIIPENNSNQSEQISEENNFDINEEAKTKEQIMSEKIKKYEQLVDNKLQQMYPNQTHNNQTVQLNQTQVQQIINEQQQNGSNKMKQMWNTQADKRIPPNKSQPQIDPKINEHWTPQNQTIVRDFFKQRDQNDPNFEEMNKTNSSGNNTKLTEDTFNKIKDQLLNDKIIYDLNQIEKGKLYRQGGMNGFLNPKMEVEHFNTQLYIMGTSQKLQRELKDEYQLKLNKLIKERQTKNIYYIYINTGLNQEVYGNISVERLVDIFQRAQNNSPHEENVIYSLARRIVLMIEKYIKNKNNSKQAVIETETELERLTKQVAGVLQDAANSLVEIEPITIHGENEVTDVYFIPMDIIKQIENQVQQQQIV